MAASSDRLQINENMGFQRREWRFQQIGWWTLAAFVVAAVLGLFGGGPLSRASASAGGTLRVDYERFVRVGTVTRLVIHAQPAGGGDVALHLDRAYFDGLRVERIIPEPSAIDTGADTVALRFAPAGPDLFTVTLDAQPLHVGRHHTAIAIDHQRSVAIRQFAYF